MKLRFIQSIKFKYYFLILLILISKKIILSYKIKLKIYFKFINKIKIFIIYN